MPDTPAPDEPVFSPSVALVTFARDVEVRLAAVLEPHSLTLRKYAVLQRIATTPGLSLPDLARGARTTERGVGTIVRGLVDAGWVRAGLGPGGLPAQIVATPAGSALLDRLRREVTALDEESFATDARRELAAALLGVEAESSPQNSAAQE